MCRELKELRRIYPGATREQLQMVAKVLLNSGSHLTGNSKFHLYEAKK